MYKVGMNTMLWTDNVTLDRDKDLIEKIMGMGFDGVEFPVHAGMDIEEAKRLGAYMAEKGYEAIALGVLDPSYGNMISSSKSERDSGVAEVCRHVDMAKELGSDRIIGPYTQGLGYFSGERLTKQEWQWSVECAKQICEYAAKKDIKVAFEPLNRFEQLVLNTAEKAVEYVKEIDMSNAGLLMDTMHMNIEELSVPKALIYAMPYTFHIHISENDRGIPGTGHACGKDVFDAIKSTDYEGWLNIEAFNEGAPSLQGPLHLWRTFAPSDDDLARQGLAYIREMIAED